jgi:16S rRNA (cytosine967-C5)-methyltransferase
MKEPIFRDPEAHPLLWAEDALSLPATLGKGWVRRHGTERAFDLARLALEDTPLSLVALGTPRETLAEELAALDVPTVPGNHPRVLLAPASETQRALEAPAFREGRATVPGETALHAAELLDAQAGMRILELCAAPGGKTAVLARTGAEVVAVDVSATRLARVRSTLERLAPEARVHTLASNSDSGLAPDVTFDAALVDAPCSNTGVLGQRPGARWRYGPAQQRELCALQARLLEGAAARVRVGGRLVYSTCSLEPEENGQGVRAFIENHAQWSLISEREALPGRSDSGGPTDGGYAALLERGSGE